MADAKYLLPQIDLTEFNLGIISHFSVREMINFKEEDYEQFLIPFMYDLSHDTEEIKFFDYLFFEDAQLSKILFSLIKSLQLLYKTKKFDISTDNEIMNINIADASINRNNFNRLCEVIREMFFIKPKEQDEENAVYQVSEQNKSILEEYLRLKQEHEKEMEELNKKNQKTIHQLVTIVASQCLWDFDRVLDMTYYRLIVTYISIAEIDSYVTYIKYHSSGQFDMKNQKQKHWLEIVGK